MAAKMPVPCCAVQLRKRLSRHPLVALVPEIGLHSAAQEVHWQQPLLQSLAASDLQHLHVHRFGCKAEGHADVVALLGMA